MVALVLELNTSSLSSWSCKGRGGVSASELSWDIWFMIPLVRRGEGEEEVKMRRGGWGEVEPDG